MKILAIICLLLALNIAQKEYIHTYQEQQGSLKDRYYTPMYSMDVFQANCLFYTIDYVYHLNEWVCGRCGRPLPWGWVHRILYKDGTKYCCSEPCAILIKKYKEEQ